MRVIEEASVGEARNIVWGGGEPTLNPDLSSYIRNAHSLGLCSAMATNGVLLSDVLSKINPNMLTDIRLSIDTINPAIFSRMCSGSPEWLQRVMQNTKDAIQAGYNITVQTTVTPDNIGCLDELISFCSELGVPRIFLSPANMGYDIALSDNFLSKGQLRDLEFLVAESANNSNITSRVELMFTGSMKPQWCGGLFYSMAIHSNGYVSPCPVLGTPVVGNISVSSISDVWHGEKYCQLRRHASLKEFMPELCSECTSAESCKTGCYLIKHAASVDYRGPDPRCTNHHVPGIS
jgi:radical SAM protein with 4Fe4S-binding SPASM domain